MLCIVMTVTCLLDKLQGKKRQEEDTEEKESGWREVPEEEGGDEIQKR